jgi:1-deoxy-D-xylulose-5-phosphate synthase
VVAITAAMPDGTGLVPFSREFPDRFFDVGIAEQHAVTFAGGLACRGVKPVVAIYSTFLQRAYDQVIHDIALQKLNVFFVMDRAGLVGADGPTHHGTFDLAFLRAVPNLVIMAPKDENELRHMLKTGVEYDEGPIAVRYPRGSGLGVTLDDELVPLPIGKAEVLHEGHDLLLLGIGVGAGLAEEVAARLRAGGVDPTVVNARFVKPLDEELILSLAARHRLVATIEEGTVRGGFGSAVMELLHERLEEVPPVRVFGLPDEFSEHGSPEQLHRDVDFTVDFMANELRRKLENPRHTIDLAGRRRARGS